MPISLTDVVLVALIGLASGAVGGLAGVGGSLIALPLLVLVLGDNDGTRHHVYAAAAMIMNVLVAIPATRVHLKKKTVRASVVIPLLITGLPAIVIGVLVSNQYDGESLRRMLAVFVGGYSVFSIYKAISKKPEDHTEFSPSHQATVGLGTLGGFTGFCSGLLGIGGGGIMVPAMQVLIRVPLKQAVSASSTVMVVTAVIGASLKVGTIGEHERTASECLVLAAVLGPLAMVGSFFGAKATHALPIRLVRLLVATVLSIAAVRMAGLI
ncbi:MAG: sulfite exporter TauE/SafE family protein [Planctomycetota bacterium]